VFLDGIAVSKCAYSYETDFDVNVIRDIPPTKMVDIAMVGEDLHR
jgi:hypothetical protein